MKKTLPERRGLSYFIIFRQRKAAAAARRAGLGETHDVCKAVVCALSFLPGMDL